MHVMRLHRIDIAPHRHSWGYLPFLICPPSLGMDLFFQHILNKITQDASGGQRELLRVRPDRSAITESQFDIAPV